ncbi:MAG: hypothetical protein IPM94_15575 [bacterium]|nr:hypothetical protein [bacterium]
MKKNVAMLALAVMLLGAGSALAAEKAWLDLENCGIARTCWPTWTCSST